MSFCLGVSASRPDVLFKSIIDHNSAVMRRGAAKIDPERFDISKLYLVRESNWIRRFERVVSRARTMVGFGK